MRARRHGMTRCPRGRAVAHGKGRRIGARFSPSPCAARLRPAEKRTLSVGPGGRMRPRTGRGVTHSAQRCAAAAMACWAATGCERPPDHIAHRVAMYDSARCDVYRLRPLRASSIINKHERPLTTRPLPYLYLPAPPRRAGAEMRTPTPSPKTRQRLIYGAERRAAPSGFQVTASR
jgi:hypothetical protein